VSQPTTQLAAYTTNSAEQTIAIGRSLASILPPQMVLLRGDLGAGKTTLVKGIAQALGAASLDEVTSPTYTLVHQYSAAASLYHLDLYRIEHERELIPLGIEEMEDSDSLLLIEWGEKFPSLRRRAWGEIHIAHLGADDRQITVTRFS
jgi:tRNA threonylcarbamoyladenosine biosynthesis protein TsaE